MQLLSATKDQPIDLMELRSVQEKTYSKQSPQDLYPLNRGRGRCTVTLASIFWDGQSPKLLLKTLKD